MVRVAPKSRSTAEDGERVELLRQNGEALAPPESRDFAVPFSRFGAAQLVLLGEATHGTSEFYRARAAISRQLIEKHEADWPDAARIDRYIRHRPPEPSKQEFRAFSDLDVGGRCKRWPCAKRWANRGSSAPSA